MSAAAAEAGHSDSKANSRHDLTTDQEAQATAMVNEEEPRRTESVGEEGSSPKGSPFFFFRMHNQE